MDFDGFDGFEEDVVKDDKSFTKDYKENNTKDYSNYNNYKKKRKGIDLFKENPDGVPINTDNFKIGQVATIVISDKNLVIDKEDKNKIKNVLKLLNDKGYKVRILCGTINPILNEFMTTIKSDNVEVVKPWDKFCKSGKYKKLFPSDDNIKAAVYHYPKFDKLPTGVKYINSALMTVLFGRYNNEPLEYVIVYDPSYDGKKIDFKKSRDTAFYYWFPKKVKGFSTSVFNLAEDTDYYSLIKLLR